MLFRLKIERKLPHVEGISDVQELLTYEGTVMATVQLDNGGLIEFNGIHDEQFVSTDRLDVIQMSGIVIHCEYAGQPA